MFNWNLRDYQQKLTLPQEAVQWEDATILEYWQTQQHKVMAFACGLHNRLGAVSQVSSIDESMLMHITNELPGGRSLMQQWQREQLAQKTATVSWACVHMHTLGRYAVINGMNQSRLESDVLIDEIIQGLQESRIQILQRV